MDLRNNCRAPVAWFRLDLDVISHGKRIGGSDVIELENALEPCVPHLAIRCLHHVPASCRLVDFPCHNQPPLPKIMGICAAMTITAAIRGAQISLRPKQKDRIVQYNAVAWSLRSWISPTCQFHRKCSSGFRYL